MVSQEDLVLTKARFDKAEMAYYYPPFAVTFSSFESFAFTAITLQLSENFRAFTRSLEAIL